MFIWSIAEAPWSFMPLMAGIAHRTPLPNSMDWSITSTATIADKRCGRLMLRKLVHVQRFAHGGASRNHERGLA